MSVVGITENVKGDSKKFEIWCNSREEVYIVQVSAYNKKPCLYKQAETWGFTLTYELCCCFGGILFRHQQRR